MVGVDAETLHAMRESDPAAYERAVGGGAAQFADWRARNCAKTEEYRCGESRRRLTVLQCAKPDYAAEAKHLLERIRAVQA